MDLPTQYSYQPPAEVRVDIQTLRQFGVFLRGQLDDDLSPMMASVSNALAGGGDIGPDLPSEDLQLMNIQHAACVSGMIDQLRAIQKGISILASAALEIADRYSSSDMLAHTTIANITPALNLAVNATSPLDGRP